MVYVSPFFPSSSLLNLQTHLLLSAASLWLMRWQGLSNLVLLRFSPDTVQSRRVKVGKQ